MLKLVDLANRADFDAGPLRVSPATRTVTGPAGIATLEPIVMKVFLLLLDAGGGVVTRDELFASAWGGVFVGDDSLNRAIGRVRKIAGETAPGLFEIETIPRTGYRLTGEILASAGAADRSHQANSGRGMSRRVIVGSGAAVVLAGGAGLGLWWSRSADDDRFNGLLKRAREGLDYGDGSPEPANYLRQAVAMRPRDAAAQGLLAFALTYTTKLRKNGSDSAVDEAQEAANTSLRLDPAEPNARLALIQLQTTLDLATTEDRVRGILATAPDNILAMRVLWSLLQSAGRSRDALALVQRAVSIKPLAAANNYPLAQLLWIVGRTSEADRIIDRAMESWPKHRYVRFARFTIFAFTGRPRAALAMLDSDETRPQGFSPASVALYRISLAALDQPSRSNVAEAVRANADAVKQDPKLASQAVLTLCALGQVDAAFEIANDLLLFRVPSDSAVEDAAGRRRVRSTAWRFTPWLFTPPAAPLRADPRFAALCDGTGLTDYWTKRRIKPDYQLVGA